jgi:hypothetical protein
MLLFLADLSKELVRPSRSARPRRAAIAVLLSLGASCAGQLLAAPTQDDLAQMTDPAKAAGREQATRMVRSMTDQMLAQFPNFPPEKRTALEAAAQRYLSEVDNSFDHYAAALREIATPSQADSVQPEESPLGTSPLAAGDVTATAAPVPRLQSPARPAGWNPSVPDGKVVANSVSGRCERPPTESAPHNVSATGRSVLCVCVNEKGTLTQDPVITESSGDSRVDSGAVKLARLDSGRYKLSAADGTPQKGCFRFAVNFRHAE